MDGVIFMKVGIIGLGKMGYNISLNALDNNHEIVIFDKELSNIDKLTGKTKAISAKNIKELVQKLETPRYIWLMVPSGQPVDDLITELAPMLDKGDTIIDGGNSHYEDTIRHGKYLDRYGINLLDIGTSGGLSGARHGACMMVGGSKKAYDKLKPFLDSLCVPNGVEYVGKSGAGHFVKMIHNGIEYGMMQSIGEGFEILKESEFDLDYKKISKVWSNGSIISGLLMELIADSFSKDKQLDKVSDNIGQNGEGLWTIETALKLGVPTPVLTASIFARFRSNQREDIFSAKVVQALRQQFGGHNSSIRIEKSGK